MRENTDQKKTPYLDTFHAVHDTTLKSFNLLTINFKDEPFHNSIEWLELYLHVNIPPWLGKTFRFTVFGLLENAFCESSPSPYFRREEHSQNKIESKGTS